MSANRPPFQGFLGYLVDIRKDGPLSLARLVRWRSRLSRLASDQNNFDLAEVFVRLQHRLVRLVVRYMRDRISTVPTSTESEYMH